MNSMLETIDVSTLLENANAYAGKPVTLSGNLIVQGDECFMVALDDHDDKSSAEINTNAGHHGIVIALPGLVAKLLDQLPCYLGSKILYNDSAMIEGIIAESSNDSPIQLSDVSRLVVTRESNDTEIAL